MLDSLSKAKLASPNCPVWFLFPDTLEFELKGEQLGHTLESFARGYKKEKGLPLVATQAKKRWLAWFGGLHGGDGLAGKTR